MVRSGFLKIVLGVWMFFSGGLLVQAQQHRGCATGHVMENYFKKHPTSKIEFEKRQRSFQDQYTAYRKNKQENRAQKRLNSIITVPVVVHIVMDNPNLVSDEQVQSQLDILNADFAGENGDLANVPETFRSVIGRSQIRFCLAQRTPSNNITNGIIRKVSTTESVPGEGDPIKSSAQGGSNAWDVTKYLNIWVCKMANEDDLGYSFMPELPGLSPNDQGLVTSYQAFGTIGTARAPFNKGRTATHEIGHFFNLWHIWGSNDCASSCSDSDFVDDTPNQDKCTYGTPVFPLTDACTNTNPGIMFMNFMDYVNDAAMFFFTQGQADRMEASLEFSSDRSGLMHSNACVPPVVYNRDVQAEALVQPANSIVYCNDQVTPAVTIRNLGSAALASVVVNVEIDNAAPVSKTVNLNLASLQRTTISAASVPVSAGQHTIKVYTTSPNGAADQNITNDTITTIFSVAGAQAAPVKKDFEHNSITAGGWGVANTSDIEAYNPVRVTTASHSGNASVKFNSFQYNLSGKYAVLGSPEINVPLDVDSVKVTFWRAAGQKNALLSDSLQVLISTDCGQTFQSVYKIGGSVLNPEQHISATEYIPASTDWVADTVDLSGYIAGKVGSFMVQFRGINGYGNNIYLDDINIYTRKIPTALKEKGLTITPNPTRSNIVIQHYPVSNSLRGVAVYSSSGQLVWLQSFSGTASPNYIEVPLFNRQSGVYFVKLFYTDNTITRKVLKLN